ncbi:phage tail protein [Kitasatospora sp. NPDC092948]|uniref:phage tail protein n=1 Tax=Kitasatospora sp. NPDC092948 TaxID=3364088 RepID=UPI003830211B
MAGELITTDGQMEWRGLLLGERSPYAGRILTGWDDLPPLDDGTVLRAQQHGAVPGRLLARARVLSWDAELIPEDPAADALWPQYLAALRAATGIQQDEQPLVVQLGGQRLQVMARVTARTIPADQQYTWGYPKISLEWTCSDPLRYDTAAQSVQTGLPTAETGLVWGSPETGLAWGSPAETGLVWGSPGSTGDVLCTNAGDTSTGVAIEIHGPCVTPSITVYGTTTVLEYALTLTAADVLYIDTQAGTVLLGGQDRQGTATARSVPEESVRIPPGDTVLSFRSADPATTAASATVRWRSAYW